MRGLLLAFLLGACRASTAPSSALEVSVAAAVPEPECTLETQLVPGVPGSPGNLLPSEVNPNGASELAALMRRMQHDLASARERLAQGGTTDALYPHYRRMRCSWPTDLADRNPTFDHLAKDYLARVRTFDAETADRKAAFNNVLGGCRACHEVSCPGPLTVIDGLRL